MINKINRNFSKSCYLQFIETSYRKISAIWKRNNSKSTFNTNPKFYTRRSESRYKSDWNIQQSQKKKRNRKKYRFYLRKHSMEECYFLKAKRLHGSFSRFLNWTNSTKSRNTSQIQYMKSSYELRYKSGIMCECRHTIHKNIWRRIYQSPKKMWQLNWFLLC